MDKTVDAADVIRLIPPGASIAAGGFGLCGVPYTLIDALRGTGTSDLHIISNNCGVDDAGLGILLSNKQIRRMTSSYVGENAEFARQFLAGELEVELCPQGTLAERLRAGGAGIPAFYTPAGVGTQVAEGGLPWRYDGAGGVAVASPPKEVRTFTIDADLVGDDAMEREYVLERAIVADFAIVRAARGDRHGNLVYEATARNFNPLCAAAGRVTIAEVEELVEPGEIPPGDVHTPGIFVQHVVGPVGVADKKIERRTVRERSS